MKRAEIRKRAERWLATMDRVLPCSVKVDVQVKPPNENDWGTCELVGDRFVITLPDLSRMTTDEKERGLISFILEHEYAHARRWAVRPQAESGSHDAHYGVELALVTERSGETE